MKMNFDWMVNIFLEVFDLEDYEITPSSECESVPGWDSLGHMALISKIENEHDIEFDLEEIIGADTAQKILDLVNNKLKV